MYIQNNYNIDIDRNLIMLAKKKLRNLNALLPNKNLKLNVKILESIKNVTI